MAREEAELSLGDMPTNPGMLAALGMGEARKELLPPSSEGKQPCWPHTLVGTQSCCLSCELVGTGNISHMVWK